jgi:hypothetical protein
MVTRRRGLLHCPSLERLRAGVTRAVRNGTLLVAAIVRVIREVRRGEP